MTLIEDKTTGIEIKYQLKEALEMLGYDILESETSTPEKHLVI